MKKLFVFLLAAPFIVALQFCSSSKKNAKAAKSVTYVDNVQPILQLNCTPCHFPPKGSKKAYDNYTAVKTDIGEILERVHKNPDEKGFMPFKHPKLSDSTIQVLEQWRNTGLAEK